MQIADMRYLDADSILARDAGLIHEKERRGIVLATARISPVQQALWEVDCGA